LADIAEQNYEKYNQMLDTDVKIWSETQKAQKGQAIVVNSTNDINSILTLHVLFGILKQNVNMKMDSRETVGRLLIYLF
jgi:hypothetical protein